MKNFFSGLLSGSKSKSISTPRKGTAFIYMWDGSRNPRALGAHIREDKEIGEAFVKSKYENYIEKKSLPKYDMIFDPLSKIDYPLTNSYFPKSWMFKKSLPKKENI